MALGVSGYVCETLRLGGWVWLPASSCPQLLLAPCHVLSLPPSLSCIFIHVEAASCMPCFWCSNSLMSTSLCGENGDPVLTPPCGLCTVTRSALLHPGLKEGCTTLFRLGSTSEICFFSAGKILLRPQQGKPDTRSHKDTLKLVKQPGVL